MAVRVHYVTVCVCVYASSPLKADRSLRYLNVFSETSVRFKRARARANDTLKAQMLKYDRC